LRRVTDKIRRPATELCSPRATVSTSGSSGIYSFLNAYLPGWCDQFGLF
jgi:hypothetical protein